MADGGTLAFGLRHVYPIEESLEHVHNILKGSDAVVYQTVHALGFEPVLYVYYEEEYSNPPEGAMIDKLIKLSGDQYEGSVPEIVQEEGGTPVRQVGRIYKTDEPKWATRYTSNDKDPELVEWVTPLTTYNHQEGAFVHYGNDASLNWAYGDVCMIVRIGKAGDRLAFPTAAQVKNEYLQHWKSTHPYGLY